MAGEMERLAAEVATRERALHELRLWTEQAVEPLARAMIKQQRKLAIVERLGMAGAYIRAAQRELLELEPELRKLAAER
ncbi:MAG: hypothetical protein HYU88_14590 [Chloroflexi bacterium]|nr:hypothetical protein [Chloroflexota bacterium]MBI4504280.1 hypothetical protein [Chloroflexota bacterium]